MSYYVTLYDNRDGSEANMTLGPYDNSVQITYHTLYVGDGECVLVWDHEKFEWLHGLTGTTWTDFVVHYDATGCSCQMARCRCYDEVPA